MDPKPCPGCQSSMNIQESATPILGRCPVCGGRIRAAAPVPDPAMTTAIAQGPPPPKPFSWRELPETLPYLGRLLRRMRLQRGDAIGPAASAEPPAGGWLLWALFVYVWFPALSIGIFLMLLPIAVWAVIMQTPPGPTVIILSFFMASLISLTMSVIWCKSRGRD
jgi:hypothetical protein